MSLLVSQNISISIQKKDIKRALHNYTDYTEKNEDSVYSSNLSKVEEEALEEIKTGKTNMTTQSGEEFLNELDNMINE